MFAVILFRVFALMLAFDMVASLYSKSLLKHYPMSKYESRLRPTQSIALYSSSTDKEDIPDASKGQGEWSDWENDSYYEDEFVPDGDAPPLSLLSAMNLANTDFEKVVETSASRLSGKSGLNKKSGEQWNDDSEMDFFTSSSNKEEYTSVVQERWSEEAPYFDEADVQDDEGNWGRSVGAAVGGMSSTVWMSRAEYAVESEKRYESGGYVPQERVESTSMKNISDDVQTKKNEEKTSVIDFLKIEDGTILQRMKAVEDRVIDLRIQVSLYQGILIGSLAVYLLLRD